MKSKKTLRLEINKENLKLAGKIIRDGGLVAFPTETVYGLGADALNPEAVASIYEAKGRPSDNPLIIHVSSIEEVDAVAYIGGAEGAGGLAPEVVCALMDEFWPGPVTFILNKREAVPHITSGGLSTVGVRMPGNKVALDFISAAAVPIAAPSANISGKPSPTTWQDVIEDMDGRIDAVLMGEPCSVGIESTVLDLTGRTATILRPGYITPVMIEKITPVKYDRALEQNPEDEDFKPMAPGMKYKHYAPRAKVRLVKEFSHAKEIKKTAEEAGNRVAILDYKKDSEAAAKDFFARLRELDREEMDLILVIALDNEELGYSVMNRMLKSAGFDIAD